MSSRRLRDSSRSEACRLSVSVSARVTPSFWGADPSKLTTEGLSQASSLFSASSPGRAAPFASTGTISTRWLYPTTLSSSTALTRLARLPTPQRILRSPRARRAPLGSLSPRAVTSPASLRRSCRVPTGPWRGALVAHSSPPCRQASTAAACAASSLAASARIAASLAASARARALAATSPPALRCRLAKRQRQQHLPRPPPRRALAPRDWPPPWPWLHGGQRLPRLLCLSQLRGTSSFPRACHQPKRPPRRAAPRPTEARREARLVGAPRLLVPPSPIEPLGQDDRHFGLAPSLPKGGLRSPNLTARLKRLLKHRKAANQRLETRRAENGLEHVERRVLPHI
eukprot:scaffold319997_cov28-Tisochrysis_lutea.AAC.2